MIVPVLMLVSTSMRGCNDIIVEFLWVLSNPTLMQTSFFARYTRDIVAFANAYTRGKVVSVLEGGYSDRALTSAAMGHVIGMLDEPGHPDWWSEGELVNVSERHTQLMLD
jgi:acetoin utilization deacetylase AcuC-like enzyme